MKKPYDKYVTNSQLFTIIGIVFVFLSLAANDKFLSIVTIICSFMFLGAAFYCMAKERNEEE